MDVHPINVYATDGTPAVVQLAIPVAAMEQVTALLRSVGLTPVGPLPVPPGQAPLYVVQPTPAIRVRPRAVAA
jgi:hypothetical protein